MQKIEEYEGEIKKYACKNEISIPSYKMVGLLHARRWEIIFLIDEKYYKVAVIVSKKINTLINYQVLNCAVT